MLPCFALYQSLLSGGVVGHVVVGVIIKNAEPIANPKIDFGILLIEA